MASASIVIHNLLKSGGHRKTRKLRFGLAIQRIAVLLALVSALERLTVAKAAEKWTPQPGDCTEFRGPNRDGILTGVSIVPDWNEHPPRLVWRKKIGPAWSSMIVVDGHLVTQEQREQKECVVCYDAATGNEIWVHEDDVRYEESVAGVGPRGTPTFAQGHIYALGARGTLNCLVAETGARVWSRDIMKDGEVSAKELPQWGCSVTPLVVDGLVVVFAGGTKDKSILAYKASDGTIAWSRPGGQQSYSSPQLVTLNGKKSIAFHDSKAIRLLNIADGAETWSQANGGEEAAPMLQPHVVPPSDLVLSMSPGIVRWKVSSTTDEKAAPAWSTAKLRPDFSDFVIHKGLLYGLSNGVLSCFDVETGEQVWKKTRTGFGQMLVLADQDALLMSNSKGEILLVAVNRDGPNILGRFQAIDDKTWQGPVLVGNRVYLRNAVEMAAYELNMQPAKPQAPASALPTNSL